MLLLFEYLKTDSDANAPRRLADDLIALQSATAIDFC